MLAAERTQVPETAAELHEDYLAELRDVVEAVGLETARTETAVKSHRLETLLEGEDPELTLSEAAALEALDPESRDEETILASACDHLLLGMTTAVLDVETLAGELSVDLDPKEIQQKIERRSPMTLAEYAELEHTIVSNGS